MSVPTERRTQSRKRPLSLVYVELPPSNGGMMRDLSDQGFALRAMMPLQQSEKVPFSFSLDSAARIDGEAIVVWIDDNGHIAALEFAGLPAHSRDQIRRWLAKFDEPLARDAAPRGPTAAPASTFEELRSEIHTTGPRPSAPPAAREIPPPPTLAPNLQPPPPPAPAPPALALSTAEQASPPPLLKISSVRPTPQTSAPAKVILPTVHSEPVATPPAPVPVRLPDMSPAPLPPAADLVPLPVAIPLSAPPRPAPPALEPLSSLEGDKDADSPDWMERFTLARAIGIMLFLTLLAGSYVYHRELCHALIWLGQQLAADDSPESSKIPRPTTPAAESPISAPSQAASSTNPPQFAAPPAESSGGVSGANLPTASETTPAPQLKDTSPTSLLPLKQVDRSPAAPATPASPEFTADNGQSEYQQAAQILHTPDRKAELPEAVRLLWIAVEKGNVAAEITLAELFRQGRGVPKNCDQTRILLSAAARKGSPDAQKRLEEIQRQGCEE